MTTINIFRCRPVCGALAVALLGALTGCPAAAPIAPAASAAAPELSAQPAVVAQPVVAVAQPTVMVPDGLIYYPNYEVYFDPGARVYWYSQGGRWVTGPSPSGISVDVLVGSPNVRMDFRDSPENHHREVAQQYPRNWRPAGPPDRRPPDRNSSERGTPDRGPPDENRRGN